MGLVLIGAIVIGLTLGMLGSGGSAITVPVLLYLVGHGAKESIAESMAIVGLISVAAAIPYAKARQIDWRSVWFFGIPGMIGTFVGAWLGSPEGERLGATEGNSDGNSLGSLEGAKDGKRDGKSVGVLLGRMLG